jgi:hypothetical protein
MAQTNPNPVDLFISYAIDSGDLPEPEWIDRFAADLTHDLTERLGRTPRVHVDWQDLQVFSSVRTAAPTPPDAASVFLALITPGWFYSTAAQAELAAFLKVQPPRHLQLVELLPTDHARWPDEFKRLPSFMPFYSGGTGGRKPRLFEPGGKDYLQGLSELTFDICEALRERDAPPNTWVFYAATTQWAASWIKDLQPGKVDFWRHGGRPHTLELAVGDTVVVMVGQPGGSPPGGQIFALAVLGADRSVRFDDPRPDQRTRRWPIVGAVALHDNPIDRKAIESQVGPLIRSQGAVHPLSRKAIAAINAQLAERGLDVRVPFSRDQAQAYLDRSEPLTTALTRYDFLRYDSLPPWPPRVAGAAETTGVERKEADSVGAYVPFISDAPSESEDRLDRGALALFLGRRLHLIWRQLNGFEPGAPLSVRRRRAPGPETFIVHIDAPWGGGKTTFANFLSRVLNPVGETLSPEHFLKSSISPDVDDPAELAKTSLERVFLGETEPAGDDPGHRPWIIVWSNAWRDQYITPPWWHLFQTISADVRKAVAEEARAALAELAGGRMAAALVAASANRRWAAIGLAGLGYRLMNTQLLRQLVLTVVGVLLLVGLSQFVGKPLIEGLNPTGVNVEQLKSTLDVAVAVVGLAGGGLATLGAVFSQSLAPDIDFSDESKSIGVRDPIARFRRTLQHILELAGRPVLLIVDDLDRCEPGRVVEILRGFQTIVRSSRLFVLVLGDRRWIESAHTVWHKDLKDLNVGPETALGARFVEKLFQLSFTLPAMNPEARDRYTRANLSRGEIATPSTPAASKPGPTAAGAAVESKVFAEVKAAASKNEPMPQRERTVRAVLEQSGLKGDDLARAEEAAARQLVVASGADAGYQQQVRNILTGLAGALPNNPRQIKRIFNAFAVYETVGRLYYRYEVDAEHGDDVRARRWRQLALWVTLYTDWPETWRAVARYPALLHAAYAPDEAARKAAEPQLEGDEATAIARTLRRMRADPQLKSLLAGDETAPPSNADPAALFAATALEPAAVYEFNRIMWEPDFPFGPNGAGAPDAAIQTPPVA